MPTYDYKCLDCDHSFEKFQGIKDPVLTDCPVCQGKVKRLIGAGAGLIFKGSGFYITDYRSKDYTNKAKQESEAAGGKKDSGTKKEGSSSTSSSSASSSTTTS